jgi:vitamin B12 transporter
MGAQIHDAWRVTTWNRYHETDSFFVSTFHQNPAHELKTTTLMNRIEIEGYRAHTHIKPRLGIYRVETKRCDQDAIAPFIDDDTFKGTTSAVYSKNTFQVHNGITMRLDGQHTQTTQSSSKINGYVSQNHESHQTVIFGPTLQWEKEWKTSLTGKWHHHSAFKHKVTYKAKTSYLIQPLRILMMGSIGTSIRAPTLYQLHNPLYGNPLLRPEKSIGYDIGFEHTLIEKKIKWGSTYFNQRYTDLISTKELALSRYQYVNLHNAETYGVESFVNVTPLKTLTLRTEHTYLHAKDKTTKQQLLRRPLHKITHSLRIRFLEKWVWGTAFAYTGKTADINRVTGKHLYRKGPVIGRTWIAYHIADTTEVYGRVENVTNVHADIPDGYSIPPLGVYVGIKIKY